MTTQENSSTNMFLPDVHSFSIAASEQSAGCQASFLSLSQPETGRKILSPTLKDQFIQMD